MKRRLISLLAGLVAISVMPVGAAVPKIGQPSPAEQAGLKMPPFKKVKLANGLTILLMERRQLPLISLSVVIKAGSAADPAGNEGVASVTAELLRRGTATRSADKIADELDYYGSQFGAAANPDYTVATAEFVKKDLNSGMSLLADVMQHSVFPQDEVTKSLKRRIDGIKAGKDQVAGVIGNYFYEYLYGSQPYGRPTGGDERSLASITRDDILKFYQEYYTPGNMILAAAGDFDSADMEKQLRESFGGWASRPVKPLRIPDPAPIKGKKLLLVDKPDSVQTFFMIGNVGISRTNPDRVYIEVVNTLFGGRFTSMINSELRIKSGLTYGARSFFDRRQAAGAFAISSYTQNSTTEKTLDLALEVVKRLHENGITEEQLKSAKSYIKGQFPPTIETSDQLAALLGQLEFYGLDQSEINGLFARIDSMTVADANRIIKTYFPSDNLVFVLIGKASDIGQLAAKYAPTVDRKSIRDPGF